MKVRIELEFPGSYSENLENWVSDTVFISTDITLNSEVPYGIAGYGIKDANVYKIEVEKPEMEIIYES